MIRSIVTGLVALSNPGFPHRVFSAPPAAIAWMTQGHGKHDTSTILLALSKVQAATPSALEVAPRVL